MLSDAIQFIQAWYREQSNGTWEHGHGITIESLATPGWLVRIDLEETPFEGLTMREVSTQKSSKDWMVCRVAHNQFHGEGDPQKLAAILHVFQSWASQPAVK